MHDRRKERLAKYLDMDKTMSSNAIQVTHDEIVLKVVEAIATHEGVDPSTIKEPIGDVLDPDALNALFQPQHIGKGRNKGRVVFPYYGYEVTVTATHDIYLTKNIES